MSYKKFKMNKEDLNITSVEADSKVMTMTTHRRNVKFYIVGAATVNWGDGLEIETQNLQSFNRDGKPYRVHHNYQDNENVHTITITGENVWYLECRKKSLRTLDVSGNSALKILKCSITKRQRCFLIE